MPKEQTELLERLAAMKKAAKKAKSKANDDDYVDKKRSGGLKKSGSS